MTTNNKKSFILHLDSLAILDKMTIEQKGIFIDSIYKYHVTGELPELDFGLEMAITPFINQFKRDAEKYKVIAERNKINGSKGGRPSNQSEPKEPTETEETHSVNEEPKKADNDNDSDSGNDNESDNNFNGKKFNFKQALLDLGVEPDIVRDWLIVRKNTKATNTETAFNTIKSEIEKTNGSANDCIKIAVERSWRGFKAEWYANIRHLNPTTDSKPWLRANLSPEEHQQLTPEQKKEWARVILKVSI